MNCFYLTGESEALLFPVLAVVDPRPDDLLDKILWVGALDGLRVLHRAVGHVAKTLPEPMLLKKKGDGAAAHKRQGLPSCLFSLSPRHLCLARI